jgi:hypothetical protein
VPRQLRAGDTEMLHDLLTDAETGRRGWFVVLRKPVPGWLRLPSRLGGERGRRLSDQEPPLLPAMALAFQSAWAVTR